MRNVWTLAIKDLKLLGRDYFGLFWIAVFPLMFALFFGAIFSGQGNPGARSLAIAVIDEENSAGSKAFLERLGSAKVKDKPPAIKAEPMALEQARDEVRRGKRAGYLIVKGGFDNPGGFFGGGSRMLELGIDPSRAIEKEFIKGLIAEAVFSDLKDLFTNPAKAKVEMKKSIQMLEKDPKTPPLLKLALSTFFGDLDRFLGDVLKAGEKEGGSREMLDIQVVEVSGERRGPGNSFEISFPSSILWALMGCVASFSISIVQERTQGTLLRLKTAPLSLGQLLAGKGLACFLTCSMVTLFLLAVGGFVLGVRLGQPLHLALAVASTALCFTGLMMFVSTLGKTEAGVAGAGWGIMMPLAMIGGGMVPLIAMPAWMLSVSDYSPVKWGIYSLEGAIWRGFALADMLIPCAILLAVGIVFYGLGVWSLKRSA
ncbi:MAG: ABC transporter permease [Gemmataceae bacterium]|nr:ABC transporter permease [Gemmataceae bacterium]